MEERHNNTIIREFNRKAALLLAVLLPLVCGLGTWERYAQPKPPETLEEYMEENGRQPLSFSAESGFYEEDVVLEIDAAGLLPKGAKIHYTLDGEEPTQNSPVYKGPVRLTAGGAVLPDGTEADETRNRGARSAEAEGPGKEGKKQNKKAEENTEEKGGEKAGEDAERNAEGGTAGMENTRRGYGSRFRDVMAAEPYRDRFVTILCDLMNTSFRTDNVLSLMQQLCSSSEEEFRMFFTPDYMDRITEDQNLAMEAEAGYNTRIEKDLRKYFGLKEKYLMSLSAGEGVTITWNNMLLAPGEEYTCPYYRGVQVCLSASVSPGWSFDHWEINGEPVENDQEGEEPDGAATLIVDGGSLQEKGCTVRAVSVPVEGELFIIDEVSSAGTDDWIRLYNAGTTRVDTGAYCLSDDPDNERMFRLPSTILEPGEYCVVTCSKNTSADTEILCRCNFSLTRGETLCLTPDEGMDVPGDSLRIPYMSAGCTYGRKKSGAIFRWFDKRGAHTQDLVSPRCRNCCFPSIAPSRL